MNGKRLSFLAALMLLTAGCQKPAPVAVAPPPLSPSATVAQPTQTDGQPYPQAGTASMQTVEEDSGRVIAFLQLLQQSLAEQDDINKEFLTNISPLARGSGSRAHFGNQPGTEPDPSRILLGSMETYKQKTEDLTARLMQRPVPASCQSMLQWYRALNQSQLTQFQEQSNRLFALGQNTGSTASNPSAERESQQRYQVERAKMVQRFNREVERARNLSPAIASQVPPFELSE